MIQIVWEFVVKEDSVAAFRRAYGPDGDWAILFGRHPGYHGTTLLQDTAQAARFVTIDRWADSAAFDAMRRDSREGYARLDALLGALTVSERELGVFRSEPGQAEREALLARLESMPQYLAERFSVLSAAEAAIAGPGDGFTPVEQCWHLADLEREGFGMRIRRLLDEEEPSLPDFDGARIARERRYRTRELADGLLAFRTQRAANLALLRGLDAGQWRRAGTQDGVGRVALDDLPRLMAEHDAAHRAEIEAWAAARARRAAAGSSSS
jgi:quinol monooxygenase YgiN